MSYASMTKRSAGYVVPASEYNQFIDNDEACAVAAYTTKGDLFAGTGSKAGARVAAGANRWGISYDSTKTAGISINPQKTILASRGYLAITDGTAVDVLSVTIPGGFMSTNQSIGFTLWYRELNNKGSNGEILTRFYLGSSYMNNNYTNEHTIQNSANFGHWRGECEVSALNSASAQIASIRSWHWGGWLAYTEFHGHRFSSWTENTAGDLTAKIWIDLDATHASFYVNVLYAEIYALPVGTAA
jgi:hypothetical protein